MEHSVLDNEKKALRRKMRRLAAAIPPETRLSADEGIFEHLSAMPEFRRANTIFAYWSVKTEPDTHRLIRLALSEGKRVCVPFCFGEGIMEARLLDRETALVPGLLDIPTAPAGAETVPPEALDLILVPALCFDRAGYRLGQGGGYYDRYLAACPAFSLGLCYEELLSDSVPRGDHDRQVQAVITQQGILVTAD